MTQPDLGFGAPRRKKAGRVPVTSALAYQAAHPNERASAVTFEAESYWHEHSQFPTSAELADWHARGHGMLGDLTITLWIRRGLSDALAAGLVEHAGKRKCAVSGTLALTWRVVSR
jgi:hypothetical protein